MQDLPHHFASLRELQDYLRDSPHDVLGIGPAAVERWQVILEQARDFGDETATARILLRQGWCCFGERVTDQPRRALEFYQGAVHAARQADDMELLARSLNALATVQMYLGQYETALVAFSEGLRLAQRVGTPLVQFLLLNNLANFQNRVGNDLQALDQYQRALEFAGQTGRRDLLQASWTNLMNSLLKLGRLPEAQEYYLRLMQEPQSDAWPWLDSMEVASRLMLALDNPAQALELAERGLVLAGQHLPPRLHLELEVNRSFALVALGRPDEAQSALGQMAEEELAQYSPELHAAYKLAQSRVLEAQGQSAGALEALNEHLKLRQAIREQTMTVQGYSVNMHARVALLEYEAQQERSRSQQLQEANEQLQSTQAALEQQARFDPLTGLCNRRYFSQQTADALAALGEEQQAALIFLDLDNFKAVNDLHGHAAGDDLLRQIAARLRKTVPGQVIGRIGGDEFVVLLQGEAVAWAEAIAQDILKALMQPYDLVTGHRVESGASAGLAFAPLHSRDATLLQQQADLAMYTSKRQQPGRVLRYSPELSTERERQLRLESELRGAPEREELRLYYQGRFAVDTQALEGFEALVRWQHPELGLLPPHHFIPLAEQTGMILPLGDWVLAQACMQAREWGFNESGLTMSLNVSALQFEQEDFVARVQRVLRDTGLVPTRLLLEVTETLILRDLERAGRSISELHALGVQVTMDDFGTGYSSLSVLQTLPLNHLKVDRSFVQRLHGSASPNQAREGPGDTAQREAEQTARIMLQTIVNLAHQLQMQVTAEGIETAEQMEFLHELRCDHAQGFYLSRPLTAGEIEEQFGLTGRSEL